MRFSDFYSCALRICAPAALLAGCGGSQPLIGAPGAMPVANNGSLPYHKTYRYTGSEQSFKAPAGVKKLTVVALGARGASADVGANGGRVFAIIPVTPGERLAVFVGGPGAGTSGGFNGGANGGGATSSCFQGCGYGGGGASDLREGGDKLTDRILVVGGGGGTGGINMQDYGSGGKGGGSVGGSGATGVGEGGCCDGGGGGGSGGTQDGGGSGGYGGSVGSFGHGNPGSNGALHNGGIGGVGCSGSSYCKAGGLGGGGGGGYYGGGGGGVGGRGFSSSDYGGGGGGGGGSSYIEPSAYAYRSWQGWKRIHTANGLVVLSWK